MEHLPLGVWVMMDKYQGAPFGKSLHNWTHGSFDETLADNLVFIEPHTTIRPFKWRGFTITRTGFAFSHARVRTSTACQGKTLEGGVIIDCARKEDGQHPMEPSDWWLHLYVMLSRATSLDDLLLLRAPDSSFLLQGPPPQLAEKLQIFTERVDNCREHAAQLAADLGLSKFLHE